MFLLIVLSLLFLSIIGFLIYFFSEKFGYIFLRIKTFIDPKAGDNRIIAVAHELSGEIPQKVTVITKDIHYRVKCDAPAIAQWKPTENWVTKSCSTL